MARRESSSWVLSLAAGFGGFVGGWILVGIGLLWHTYGGLPRSLAVRIEPELSHEAAWRAGKTPLSTDAAPEEWMEVRPWKIGRGCIGVLIRHCNPPYHQDVELRITMDGDLAPSVEVDSGAYHESELLWPDRNRGGTVLLSSATLTEELVVQYELTADCSGSPVTRSGKVLVTRADLD